MYFKIGNILDILWLKIYGIFLYFAEKCKKERRTQSMKKLFALLLALAMMMSLVACGAADAPRC